jgi:hypothetical protein
MVTRALNVFVVPSGRSRRSLRDPARLDGRVNRDSEDVISGGRPEELMPNDTLGITAKRPAQRELVARAKPGPYNRVHETATAQATDTRTLLARADGMHRHLDRS